VIGMVFIALFCVVGGLFLTNVCLLTLSVVGIVSMSLVNCGVLVMLITTIILIGVGMLLLMWSWR